MWHFNPIKGIHRRVPPSRPKSNFGPRARPCQRIYFDGARTQGAYWDDHTWKANDANDLKARTAYEALLRVSLLKPTNPQFTDFSEQVKRMANRDYNYTFAPDEEVSTLLSTPLAHLPPALLPTPIYPNATFLIRLSSYRMKIHYLIN